MKQREISDWWAKLERRRRFDPDYIFQSLLIEYQVFMEKIRLWKNKRLKK